MSTWSELRKEQVHEQDTAHLLAGRIATLEGLTPRSKPWCDRAVELYHEAHDMIENATREELKAYGERVA